MFIVLLMIEQLMHNEVIQELNIFLLAWSAIGLVNVLIGQGWVLMCTREYEDILNDRRDEFSNRKSLTTRALTLPRATSAITTPTIITRRWLIVLIEILFFTESIKQVHRKDRILLSLFLQVDRLVNKVISARVEFGNELHIQAGILMNGRC